MMAKIVYSSMSRVTNIEYPTVTHYRSRVPTWLLRLLTLNETSRRTVVESILESQLSSSYESYRQKQGL